MKHCAVQVALRQMRPEPHRVPSVKGTWVQLPVPLQTSVVQALPSLLHAAPEALLKMVQPAPLQVEDVSHTLAAQLKAVPPQVPPVHTSFLVHGVESSQVSPSGKALQALVDVPGWQL
jgi:hypothetical protein